MDTLLDALAIAEDALTSRALAAVAKALDLQGPRGKAPTVREIETWVEERVGRGELRREDRVSLPVGAGEPRVRCAIREGRYDAIARAVAEAEPLPAGYLSGIDYGYHVYYSGSLVRPGTVRRELRRAVHSGDAKAVNRLQTASPGNLWPWFADPLEADTIAALDPAIAEWVAVALAYEAHSSCRPLPGLASLIATLRAAHDTDRLRSLALYERLFREGPSEETAALAAAVGDEHQESAALHALASGDVAGAVKRFAAALAAHRKLGRTNKVLPSSPSGAFLPLAYLASGTASRRTQALSLCALAVERLDLGGTPLEGWAFLAALETPAPAPAPAPPSHPVAVLFEGLSARWSGAQPPIERIARAIEQAESCGWGWLSRELGQVRDGAGAGLLSLREVQTDWERRLEAMMAELGTVRSQAVPESRRVAWFLTVRGRTLHLEAREQILQRTGWSAGRPISAARLAGRSGRPPELTDADRRVVTALRSSTARGWRGHTETSWSWSEEDAWPALVGHPAVFSEDGRPLTIAAREPALRIRRAGSALGLTLDPPCTGAVHVEAVGDTGYEVTAFGPKHRKLAEIVGSGLSVPEDRSDRLDALLAAAAPLFARRDEGVRELAGDPEPMVLLRPSGSGLLAEVAVRPLGPDGPTLRPGTGSEIVLGSQDGASVRIRRDLTAEAARHRTICDVLGRCASWEDDRWAAPDPEAALALLGALRDAGIAALWPDGESLKLIRPHRARPMRLSVRTAGDWFAASGDLQADDGRVIELDQLLDAVMSSPGRFVRLDDSTFLELTDRLRQQLDGLARIARRRAGRAEVHALASDGLAALARDASASTDEGFVAYQRALATLPDVLDPPEGLETELRNYQVGAWRWLVRLASLPAGAILADDMGLGKTVVALAVLLHRRQDGPALVLAPTSVGGNWQREAVRFAPSLRTRRLREHDRKALLADLGPSDVVIASYGLLVSESEALSSVAWSTVVFDESQALKNPATLRHKAAAALKATFRLSLTGTPVENHLGELYAQLSLLNPGMLGSSRQFREHYQRPIESGDASVARQLKRLVAPYLLRRTKAEVLDDLPARTEVDLWVDLDPDEAAFYEALRQRALRELESSGGLDSHVALLAMLTRLRLAACSPRLVEPESSLGSAKLREFEHVAAHLREGGHRALVFSQFVGHLALLREWLDERGISYQYLDGATPARERDARVEAFQCGQGELFLISLRAGGFGLNLTAADYVVHLDPWWNPAVEDQASDRAHRLGQTRPVTIYRLIARGTVEEQIRELHRTKRDLADGLLAGADTAARLSAAELAALISDAPRPG